MDIQTIWNAALEEIKTQISKPSFETWFKPTKPISFEGNVFEFAVPHDFAANWLSSRYKNLIEEVLRGVTGNPEIEFKVVYPDEKQIHAESSKTDLDEIKNRLDRIEKKMDKLLAKLNSLKLDELLAKITPENRHDEVDFGVKGKEII